MPFFTCGRLRWFGRDAAKLVVVDQLGHGRIGAADRAIGILAQLQLAEAHGERVDEEQAADQRLAFAEDQLDDFGGLDDADDAGKNAQDAALGAAWDKAGRGRFGVEAAVARAFFGGEDAGLALEAEDAAVGVGLVEQHAGVIDQVAGLEVVGAVGNDVVLGEDLEGVGAGQHGVVLDDVQRGIEGVQLLLRGVDLLAADVFGRVNDLALQIARVDHVEVDQAQSADTRRSQVQGEW